MQRNGRLSTRGRDSVCEVQQPFSARSSSFFPFCLLSTLGHAVLLLSAFFQRSRAPGRFRAARPVVMSRRNLLPPLSEMTTVQVPRPYSVSGADGRWRHSEKRKMSPRATGINNTWLKASRHARNLPALCATKKIMLSGRIFQNFHAPLSAHFPRLPEGFYETT